MEEINEETEATLRVYNSQMREKILLKFGMWDAEGGGHLHYEINLSSTREHGAMHENHVLVLPVNILTVWRVGLLGHTTLCIFT